MSKKAFHLPYGKYVIRGLAYGGNPVKGECQLCGCTDAPEIVLGIAASGAALKVICPRCGDRVTLARFLELAPLGAPAPEDLVIPPLDEVIHPPGTGTF